MGTARTIESFWLCGKRWDLEAELAKAGHRFPKSARARRPMSGAEHGALILAWLDSRGDPEGHFDGTAPEQIEEVENAAHWTGKPGVLWSALVNTGWIDVPADGRRPSWHDYGAFNRKAMAARGNGSLGGRPVGPNGPSERTLRRQRGQTHGQTDGQTQAEPTAKQSGVRSPESFQPPLPPPSGTGPGTCQRCSLRGETRKAAGVWRGERLCEPHLTDAEKATGTARDGQERGYALPPGVQPCHTRRAVGVAVRRPGSRLTWSDDDAG